MKSGYEDNPMKKECMSCGEILTTAKDDRCSECHMEVTSSTIPKVTDPVGQTHASHLVRRQAAKLK